MRELKYHEKKLLRKVSLYSWNKEENLHVAKVLRRYHIQRREDYVSYNRLCGMITKLSAKLKALPQDDSFRVAMTDQLLEKLQRMGVINTTKSLQKCDEITTSAFCRRRLPVICVKLKMAETLQAAITFIEQGQVRVGPNVITDPSFLVSRSLEDYVTWVDSSKIRRTIAKYNDQLDDLDLLQSG